MNRKRWIVVLIGCLLVLGIVLVFIDPQARVLGRLRGEPVFQDRYASAWRHELGQTDEVKATAARETLTNGKGEALAVCIWLLENAPEPAVRARASDALKQMGAEARPAAETLLKATNDPDSIVRGIALQAVVSLAPDLPDGALTTLTDHFPNEDAIKAVAKFGPAAAPALPRLVELMKHDDPAIRFQAIRALGRIGSESIPQVPEFIRLMGSDPGDKVREISAEVIGALGPAAVAKYPQAAPALAKALKDPAWNVRRDAVRSLGQIGTAAQPFFNEVKAVEKDENEQVRTAAARSLRQISSAK